MVFSKAKQTTRKKNLLMFSPVFDDKGQYSADNFLATVTALLSADL